MNDSAPARAKLQQRAEELGAATARALTGKAQLYFRGQRLHDGASLLPRFAPHLHPALEGGDTVDVTAHRGATDGYALRLTQSDLALHDTMRPDEAVERRLFDLLEQMRVEALAPPHLPGLRHNLRQRFEQWSVAYHHSGLNESARGIVFYTLAQMCRSRVSGEPVLALTEELIDGVRGMLVRRIGPHLYALRQHRHDQPVYAQHALAIARIAAELLHTREDERGDEVGEQADTRRDGFLLLFDGDDSGNEATTDNAGVRQTQATAALAYRVYTRAYDREVRTSTLARPALLAEFRERLDRQIAKQHIAVTRLARDLQWLLATPAVDGWDAAQEEGRIDGRRLARLITTPTERHLFRAERLVPLANSVVTFLVDCSGSMRRYAPSVAVLTDVFARALERAGVACEILGFSTGAWNGGRVMRDWQRAGKPANPGRLNEACHLVFKDADTPWRRARPTIAAMFKEDIFRESIDGEAVEWACRRLMSRDEAQRFLLVISDGSPMDGATQLANGAHYLDQHLQDVVRQFEQTSRIRILGLGAGMDLGLYYRHSLTLDLAAPPGNAVFAEVLHLMAHSLRSRG